MTVNDKKRELTKDSQLVKSGRGMLDAYQSIAKEKGGTFSVNGRLGIDLSLGAAGVLQLNDDLRKHQRDIVQRLSTLLTAPSFHEQAINSLLNEHGHRFVVESANLDTAVVAMLKALEDNMQKSITVLFPNMLFRLDADVGKLDIGKVSSVAGESLNELIKHGNSRLVFVEAQRFDKFFFKDRAQIDVPPNNWVVELLGSTDNAEQEALWRIDIALSLLRLSHSNWDAFAPRFGTEAHPVKPTSGDTIGVKFDSSGKSTHFGGFSLVRWYTINADVVRTTQQTAFKDIAASIFNPKANSVAERISQGLAWLTRGRRAEDPAERLLYFFTSIEALLTGSDASAPVVQTIARHAGVMLFSESEDRFQFSKKLKKLYSVRSGTVHSGNREVLNSSATETQYYAEALYFSALKNCKMEQPHQTFYDEIAEASFGTIWPKPDVRNQT